MVKRTTHPRITEMKNDSSSLAPTPITRRDLLRGGMAASALAAFPLAQYKAATWKMDQGRPPVGERKFQSPAIEAAIQRVKALIADPVLGRMFERCFPNTLDTTVFPGSVNGKPDTFVITGDIDAMWLRDSSAQVHPYLPFARQDAGLARLLEGVVRRQTRMILIDPYANAFMRSTTDPPLSWSLHDRTTMKPGVAERKWEIDSLCYTVRLAHGYWQATGDTSPFDAEWRQAAQSILTTFKQQQRLQGQGPYSFGRLTTNPYDTLALNGYGNVARPVGMIYSMFRPSDDSCVYPLFVPANLFAVRALEQLQELAAKAAGAPGIAEQCESLLETVRAALRQYGTVQHPEHGRIWAYEVDGYGNTLCMDDANVPSLLSLPYLGCCDSNDPLYQNTRRFVLSTANPWYFEGSAAQGIGSPHTGRNAIWPMSLLIRALTSTHDEEIVACLRWLRNTTGGTGYMHESFDASDPSQYTRPWFAWANTLFGELVLKLAHEKPSLLQQA
ncbi:Tat pathway signal sequence domain protein [Acidobacterium capsulatum ATCC 51196]|uniref:Tat pathway signal sequence domain protein n=2 Tax=Acidobacteriaceae TaxID=204434 RepID=C1F7W6_ACIC5|nr:Tat pathway signal sequence domain protein [Acidobacterium capsulatum ATCC 51196]